MFANSDLEHMDTHQDPVVPEVGARRRPAIVMVWPLNRPVRWLGAASALESTSRLAQNNSLPNYRADLLQEPEKKTYPETSISDVSKRLFAGGIAGAIAKTAIAPLDRVKIIFQTHPSKVFSLANVVKELVLSPMPFRTPPCVLALFNYIPQPCIAIPS